MSFSSSTALAAGPTDIDQVEQTLNARQQYQDRQRELERIAPPSTSVQILPSPSAPPAGARCFTIRRIEIAGVTLFTPAAIHAATAPFLGQCLGLRDLDRVINAVNGLYIEHGYVTGRAYLPQQSLAGGILKLVVIEGRVAGFRFKGRKDRGELAEAFPGLVGGPLNLRDVEQGLDQMNRLAGWNTKIQIVPGQRTGSSVIVVDAPAAPVLDAKLGYDNEGGAETGRNEAVLDIGLNDALGLLDSWAAEYRHDLDLPGPPRFADVASLNVSLPYGYWTWNAGYDYSDYHYVVVGLTESFAVSGATERYSTSLDRVLHRTQSSKTSLELGYELKRETAYLDNVELVTQSQDLAALDLRLSYTTTIWGGAWYATFGVKRGFGGLGTSVSGIGAPTPSGPHSIYIKPSLDLNGFQPVHLGALALEWDPTLHLEDSSRTLFGSEQLTVGGPYSVRGFRDQSLLGEEGGYLRNDVVAPLPAMRLGLLDRLLQGPELYLGLDGGWVAAAIDDTPTDGAIAGAVLGLRNTGGPLRADVSLAHALADAHLPDEGWLMNCQLSVLF